MQFVEIETKIFSEDNSSIFDKSFTNVLTIGPIISHIGINSTETIGVGHKVLCTIMLNVSVNR